ERVGMDVWLRLPARDGPLDEAREVGSGGSFEPGRETVPQTRVVTDVDHEAGNRRHDLGTREEPDRVACEAAEISREVPAVAHAERQIAGRVDGRVHQLGLGAPAPVDRRAVHAGAPRDGFEAEIAVA